MKENNDDELAARIRHHHEELKRELAEIDQRFPDCGHENGSVVHLDEGYRWQCDDCGYTREVDRPLYTARAAFPRQPEQTVEEVKRLAGAERARLHGQIKKLLAQREAGAAMAAVMRRSLAWGLLASPIGSPANAILDDARAALAQWEEAK